MNKYGLNRMAELPRMRFGTYLRESQLLPIPATFGRTGLFPRVGWGMLGNDQFGDCTICGAMHASMCWNKIVGRDVRFTTLDAQEDYSAVTGYISGDDSTDTGADMQQVASYWRDIGMRDAHSNRHKIGAYLSGNPDNFDHLYAGCYLLGPVGLGITVPQIAGQQFDAGEPWHIVPGSPDDGYHYVPLIDHMPNGNALVVTWGAQQEVEQAWLAKYLKEVVYYVSEEMLINGVSPQGFALVDLMDDLPIVSASLDGLGGR